MFKRKPKHQQDKDRVRRPQYGGSGKVFSYYSSSNDSSEVEAKNRKERSLRAKFLQAPAVLAGVLIVVCLGYNLYLNTEPRLIVEGRADDRLLLEPEAVYRTSAAEALDSSIFNRSKLTINPQELSERLMKQHPELASAEVSLPLIGQRPIVYVTPAAPFMVLDAESGIAYVLDKSGRVISTQADRAPSDIVEVEDSSGLQFALNDQALASEDVRFVQEILAQLAASDITVSRIELPAGSHSLHVRLQGKPYYIKFTFESNARVQAGAFIAAYQRMEKDDVTPKQYVDVRAGERVYYK